MKVSCKTFWLPKRGNANSEYEDAASHMEPLEVETDEFKCAVADGATEASFSDRWAKILVKGFVEGTEFADLREQWSLEIKDLDLPWYAAEKAEAGAFATLAGLTLMDVKKNDLRFHIRAVGDSCVLHVRDEKLLQSFPLTAADEFNNSPMLLPSTPQSTAETETLFVTREGSFLAGDRFFLLTDAIACWVLKRQGTTGDAISCLLDMKEQTQLDTLVESAREDVDAEGRPFMRNDDVTVLSIEVSR